MGREGSQFVTKWENGHEILLVEKQLETIVKEKELLES
jgi:hypothetical protein